MQRGGGLSFADRRAAVLSTSEHINAGLGDPDPDSNPQHIDAGPGDPDPDSNPDKSP